MVLKKKFNGFIILGIMLLVLPLVTSLSITPFPSNPANGTTINNKSVSLGWNITSDTPINSIVFNWNGTINNLYNNDTKFYYNFDNLSILGDNSTFQTDITSYSRNITLINGTYINTGKFGNSINFDGINDYAIVNATNYINFSLDHTFCMWMKPFNLTGNFADKKVLFGNNRDSANKVYTLQLGGSGVLAFDYFNSSSGNIVATLGTTQYIFQNNWTHLCLNVNNTNSKIILYVNGIHHWNVTMQPNLIQVGTGELTLFGANRGTSLFYNGSIDEFGLYNRSLSSSEVKTIYNSYINKLSNYNYSFITNQSVNINNQNINLLVDNTFNSLTLRLLNNLNINFASVTSTIPNIFYGASGYRNLLTQDFVIDLDNNGTADNISDLTFWRSSFTNAKLKTIRKDMSLWTYYTNKSMHEFNMSGNISGQQELLVWAKANNVKIIYTTTYMPTWLGNRTNGYCNATSLGSCSPYNYTLFGEMVVDYLNQVGCTATSCDVEVWNEPDIPNFWLNNISTNNSIRFTEYQKLYNYTYNAVKSAYPTMKVGGPALSSTINYSGRRPDIFMEYVLANLTMDFFSWHTYPDSSTNINNYLDIRINALLGNCTKYNNLACNDIRIDEINTNKGSNNNTLNWNNFTTDFSLIYYTLLSNPLYNKISINVFKLGERYKYGSYDENYPSLYSMISEAGMDNTNPTYYPPYNVTKEFATYCPAGGQVVSSSSDYEGLKVVACTSGINRNFIVINTDSDSINVSVSMPGTRYVNNIKNGGTLENSSDGYYYIGIINTNEYLIFTTDTYRPDLSCPAGVYSILGLVLLFMVLGIVVLVMSLFYRNGFFNEITFKQIIYIFIMLTIGISFIIVIADSIITAC